MAQVTVGQQVLPIVPNGQHELFVTNLGPNELWYGRDGSVSAQSGQPLDPGNAVQGWPLDQTMYVVAPNGPTSVAYESNGSQVAIGAATNVVATLAPGSTVNVGNTVPVSGSVGVSGTVGIGGSVIVGNGFTLLATGTDTGVNTWSFGPPDTNNLQTLAIHGTDALVQPPTSQIGTTAKVLVQWLHPNGAGSDTIYTDEMTFWWGCEFYWQIPIRSQNFQVSITCADGTLGPNSNNRRIYIYGGNVTLPREYIANTWTGQPMQATSSSDTVDAASAPNSILYGASGGRFTYSGATTTDHYFIMPSRAGQCNYFIRHFSTAVQTILFNAQDNNTFSNYGQMLSQWAFPSGNLFQQGLLQTSESPVILAQRLTTGSGSAVAALSLNWGPQ